MEAYGVCPDIMVISKGLTCGYLPMGAVISTDKVWQSTMNSTSTKIMMSDVWQHDYTWSGHATSAAVALRALDTIDKEGMIKTAAERGATFLKILHEKLDGLHLVQGLFSLQLAWTLLSPHFRKPRPT